MRTRLASLAALLGHPRARHLLVGCGLVIGLVLALGTAWLIVVARTSDIGDAARELRNLSFVLAGEIDGSFHSMEMVQLGLIEHLREQGIDTPEKFDRELLKQDVQQDLHRRLAGLPQISSLGLISRTGHSASFSLGWPTAAIDTTGRDYFQALTHDPRQTSFISAPLRTSSTHVWKLLFARAFTGPDGQLLGIVTAGLDLDLLDHVFAGITVDGDPSFSLFRSDGVLLSRYPRLDSLIGRAFGPSGDFRDVAAAADHRVLIRPSLLDGKLRLIAPHTVAHYPLIVAATDTVAAALEFWRPRMLWMAIVAILAELVLAGVVVLGVRQLHSQDLLVAAGATAMQAEAARAQAEAELTLARQREASEHTARTLSQRFDVAVNNMSQGLLMCDAAGRPLVVNRHFIALFDLPADTARTVDSYDKLLELVVDCGVVTPDDMGGMLAWRQGLPADSAKATFNWDLAIGRTLKVTYQPMPDGWLTSYEDVTESRRTDRRIAHMARHDALTDLPNRTMFREKLEEALAHARRGQGLALLCLDLDQFKAVNDTLGHPVGDALLQAVAHRLAERTRDTDTLARLGGDEFAVVQTPIDNPTDAASFAERLIAMFDEPFQVAGHEIVIGTSVGIALSPLDGVDPDQLLKSADLALYRAKLEGRGVYRLFQTEMDAQMQERRVLELDLRNALHGGQLELFYQPLIDLRTRAVTGFEALLRWRHPTKGLVPPIAFIPLAEEIGLIVPIGEWVLRRACIAAAGWPDGMKVAVNLSPVQFKSRNLVAAVAAALQGSGLSPDRLELEITEAVMLQDTAATLATLQDMHALGVGIAMDDFGTGYSSLSYLRQFPFDRIKIDQSFVRELGKKRDCDAIVRAVTSLGHELGMATTAEGVETREQLAALVLAGCTDVQGYLFSRPVPEAAIAELLRSMPSITDMLAGGSAGVDERTRATKELLPAF